LDSLRKCGRRGFAILRFDRGDRGWEQRLMRTPICGKEMRRDREAAEGHTREKKREKGERAKSGRGTRDRKSKEKRDKSKGGRRDSLTQREKERAKRRKRLQRQREDRALLPAAITTETGGARETLFPSLPSVPFTGTTLSIDSNTGDEFDV
jgi:hypothetical protein